MDFNLAFERLISSEGAFSDDPKDPGNWTGGKPNVGELKGTKYGIAANTYGYLDIKSLTLDEAKAIYRRDYWDIMGAAHPAVKFQVFDAAVNHGAPNAIRFLQRAVGVADDGHWGPLSQAALMAREPNDVLLRFIAYRLKFWTSLSTFATYGKGWSNRAAENLLHAAEDN